MNTPKSRASIISYKFIRHHPRVNKIAAAIADQGHEVTVVGFSDHGDFKKARDWRTKVNFRLFPKPNFRLFLFRIISFPLVLIYNILARI
ncbi:hypothetical protein [Sneathiella limimaris]|uniref:hypothetical protein n=1 Tax=Sneathiella limimaris TaxID=1964213 RepID=UPI00146D47B5|nr:hypothetical protein [Sneathiella limimaris]